MNNVKEQRKKESTFEDVAEGNNPEAFEQAAALCPVVQTAVGEAEEIELRNLAVNDGVHKDSGEIQNVNRMLRKYERSSSPPRSPGEQGTAFDTTEAPASDESTSEANSSGKFEEADRDGELDKEMLEFAKDTRGRAMLLRLQSSFSVCVNCHKHSEEGMKVRKCKRCKACGYCGEECQREHWAKRHHKECQILLQLATVDMTDEQLVLMVAELMD